MNRYLEVSERVFAVFEAFTPNIEPISVDEAFLDLSGAQRLFGPGPKAAVAIKQAVKAATGLNASIGVASNKFLAKIASDMDKPDGLTVVPSDPEAIKAFLAPLSVGLIWGVGSVTRRLLEKHGFHKIADLQNLPLERLAAIVGTDYAEHLATLAIGEDSRELVMDRQRKSYSREHTFDEDCICQDELERVLCSLIEDVGSQLRADRKYVKTIQIKLRWKNFQTITRQRRLPAAVCDNTTLRECAMELFLEQTLQGPVRLIGFGTSDIADRPDSYQIGLFENRSQSLKTRERLSHVIDQLRIRFGGSSISSARTMNRPDDA
jgi:DNA polymerase IV